MNADKEGLLVIGEGMMTDSRNQSPENSKVPFRKSESVKEMQIDAWEHFICHITSYLSMNLDAL